MSAHEIIDVASMVLLAAAGLLAVGRVVRDGSLADKLLGADLLTIVIASAVAVSAAVTESDAFIDLVVVIAAVGFLAAVTVARFIEKRGARLPGETF
ncbi:MAG: monovalent cation/H+ antiporter complex subunit F [Actinomycetota bacterium]